MNLIRMTLMGCLFFAFAVSSCKKDSPNSTSSIVGNWKIDSTTDAFFSSSGSMTSSKTYHGIATDYFDFGANGAMMITISNSAGTLNPSSYKVAGDKIIFSNVDNDTLIIQSLTTHQLNCFATNKLIDSTEKFSYYLTK